MKGKGQESQTTLPPTLETVVGRGDNDANRSMGGFQQGLKRPLEVEHMVPRSPSGKRLPGNDCHQAGCETAVLHPPHLLRISSQDDFRAITSPTDGRFHLVRGQVLALVDDEKLSLDTSSTDVSDSLHLHHRRHDGLGAENDGLLLVLFLVLGLLSLASCSAVPFTATTVPHVPVPVLRGFLFILRQGGLASSPSTLATASSPVPSAAVPCRGARFLAVPVFPGKRVEPVARGDVATGLGGIGK